MMDRDEIIKLIEEFLEQKGQRRIHQMDIASDAVKQRHVGEGVRFIRAGLVASRPTTPEKDGAVYYATDEDKLYIGDGGAWLEEEFTA